MVSVAESGVGQRCLTVGVADLEELQLPVADDSSREAGLLAGQLPSLRPRETAEHETNDIPVCCEPALRLELDIYAGRLGHGGP
jgi:hypothetical protein